MLVAESPSAIGGDMEASLRLRHGDLCGGAPLTRRLVLGGRGVDRGPRATRRAFPLDQLRFDFACLRRQSRELRRERLSPLSEPLGQGRRVREIPFRARAPTLRVITML